VIRLLAAGRRVRVCSRLTGRLQPLAQLGAEVKFLDASAPKQFTTRARQPARRDDRLFDPVDHGATTGPRDPHRARE
jgi:hypothetical protein